MSTIIIAGILLLVSGISHIIQVRFFPKDRFMTAAALWGVIYLLISYLLLSGEPLGTKLGATVPILGALGGTYRYLKHQRKTLIIFHVVIDLFVIALLLV
jgi:hypothetical protein